METLLERWRERVIYLRQCCERFTPDSPSSARYEAAAQELEKCINDFVALEK